MAQKMQDWPTDMRAITRSQLMVNFFSPTWSKALCSAQNSIKLDSAGSWFDSLCSERYHNSIHTVAQFQPICADLKILTILHPAEFGFTRAQLSPAAPSTKTTRKALSVLESLNNFHIIIIPSVPTVLSMGRNDPRRGLISYTRCSHLSH